MTDITHSNSHQLARIVQIVRETGKLTRLDAEEDFYDAGFSSINALQLLMELESQFNVTIPDDEFIAARSCSSLSALMSRLAEDNR